MSALAQINSLDETGFIALLGPLYEHSPWAAQRAFAHRPFASHAALRAALRQAVDAASEALHKLYALFDVPPVPLRTVHDGNSPITATAVRWEERYQELWKLLVPSSGAAATVQGEVIRISGRISDELERNGGANWDGDYKKMADTFLEYVGSARPLSALELDEARDLISAVKHQRGDPTSMCKLAVDWVALNPEPIKLPAPAYKR